MWGDERPQASRESTRKDRWRSSARSQSALEGAGVWLRRYGDARAELGTQVLAASAVAVVELGDL